MKITCYYFAQYIDFAYCLTWLYPTLEVYAFKTMGSLTSRIKSSIHYVTGHLKPRSQSLANTRGRCLGLDQVLVFSSHNAWPQDDPPNISLIIPELLRRTNDTHAVDLRQRISCRNSFIPITHLRQDLLAKSVRRLLRPCL